MLNSAIVSYRMEPHNERRNLLGANDNYDSLYLRIMGLQLALLRPNLSQTWLQYSGWEITFHVYLPRWAASKTRGRREHENLISVCNRWLISSIRNTTDLWRNVIATVLDNYEITTSRRRIEKGSAPWRILQHVTNFSSFSSWRDIILNWRRKHYSKQTNTQNFKITSAYRVEYVIERHADVERYCCNVSSSWNRVAVVVRQNRSLDPVLARIIVVRRIALVDVSIFRSHSQVASSAGTSHRVSGPLRWSGGVDNWRRQGRGIVAHVILGDVGTLATVVKQRRSFGNIQQRSWNSYFGVWCCQNTDSRRDRQHLDQATCDLNHKKTNVRIVQRFNRNHQIIIMLVIILIILIRRLIGTEIVVVKNIWVL